MTKKSKKNFRSEWRTLTELGTEFGKSAVAFGKLLKEHGLRDSDGEPTVAANGLFQRIEAKQGKPYYLWNHKGIVAFLRSKGIEPVSDSKDALKDTEALDILPALQGTGILGSNSNCRHSPSYIA
jgi:hypothetical protein